MQNEGGDEEVEQEIEDKEGGKEIKRKIGKEQRRRKVNLKDGNEGERKGKMKRNSTRTRIGNGREKERNFE